MKPWVSSLSAVFLYCITQFSAVNGIDIVNIFLSILLTIIVVVCVLIPAYNKHLFSLFIIVIVGFPAYAADPYLDGYVPPFSYGRFPAILALLAMSKISFHILGLAIPLLLFASTLLGMVFGRIGDIDAEIWFVALLIYAVNFKLNDRLQISKSHSFKLIEWIFYCLPVAALFSKASGISSERLGVTEVYFYGHWIGIFACFAILTYSHFSSSGKLIKFFFLLFSFIVIATSFQSIHFIIVAVALFIIIKKKISNQHLIIYILGIFITVSVLFVMGNFLIANIDQDTWLYFKLNQIKGLFSGSLHLIGNSVLTRFAELLSIIDQGNIITYFFGTGIGATYLPTGNIWHLIFLHDASFPEDQLRSSVFQFVHETPVMFFKWGGLLLISILLCTFLSVDKKLRSNNFYQLTVVVFFLLVTSSLHSGLLITGLVLLAKAKNE